MGSPPRHVTQEQRPRQLGTEWIPLILDPRSLSDAWPWSSLRLYSQCPASSSPSAQVQAHTPAAVSWTAASTAPGSLLSGGTKWPLGMRSGQLTMESKDHAARAVVSVQSRGPARWE